MNLFGIMEVSVIVECTHYTFVVILRCCIFSERVRESLSDDSESETDQGPQTSTEISPG